MQSGGCEKTVPLSLIAWFPTKILVATEAEYGTETGNLLPAIFFRISVFEGIAETDWERFNMASHMNPEQARKPLQEEIIVERLQI